MLSGLLAVVPTLVLFFFFCFPRSRLVPPLRLARESWMAPLGQRGQPDSCGPPGPLPPLRVQRGGTIDALPLASWLTFVPLTCQRKQGPVCCPELVEFSRKKKGTTKEKNSIPCWSTLFSLQLLPTKKKKTGSSLVVMTIYSLLLQGLHDRQHPPPLSQKIQWQ